MTGLLEENQGSDYAVQSPDPPVEDSNSPVQSSDPQFDNESSAEDDSDHESVNDFSTPMKTFDLPSEPVTAAPKKRGRPVGAKNKPKPPSVPHQMERRGPKGHALVVSYDPSSLDEAMSRHDKDQTRHTLEDLPPNRRLVQCKWVLRTKLNPDGSLKKYKARLVAKGFSQKKGIDYHETYSPVVRYESVRIFLSIVAAEDLELSQFDVKTAFLHGDLDEEIFMAQPELFSDGSQQVCRLNKG